MDLHVFPIRTPTPPTPSPPDSLKNSFREASNQLICKILFFVFVPQSLSRVRLFATPWTEAYQTSLSFTISQSLLKLMSIESMIPSNYLITCHRLLLLRSIFPSIRVCSSELALLIRCKVLELSFKFFFKMSKNLT